MDRNRAALKQEVRLADVEMQDLIGCARQHVPLRADLDHTNQDVRESLKDWMSWLKTELGFMGWRFDFTKVRNRHSLPPALCPEICRLPPSRRVGPKRTWHASSALQ